MFIVWLCSRGCPATDTSRTSEVDGGTHLSSCTSDIGRKGLGDAGTDLARVLGLILTEAIRLLNDDFRRTVRVGAFVDESDSLRLVSRRGRAVSTSDADVTNSACSRVGESTKPKDDSPGDDAMTSCECTARAVKPSWEPTEKPRLIIELRLPAYVENVLLRDIRIPRFSSMSDCTSVGRRLST